MRNLEQLSRADLPVQGVKTYREGGGTRPDVKLIVVNDRKLVLKDHSACDPWFARLIGPILVWRESRALNRLRDVTGVPTLLICPDRRSLVMEFLPSEPVLTSGHGADWPTFFDQLAQLLATVHDHGVAHCDLRSPNNILISPDGQPVLVDFVACVLQGSRWNPIQAWIFQQFCAADRSAIAKLKTRVAPQLLTESEKLAQAHRGPLECGARWLGKSIRNLGRRVLTRRD